MGITIYEIIYHQYFFSRNVFTKQKHLIHIIVYFNLQDRHSISDSRLLLNFSGL